MAEKLAYPPEEQEHPKSTLGTPPQPKAPPPSSKMRTLSRLLGYVKVYKGKLAAVIILLLVSTLLYDLYMSQFKEELRQGEV